MQIDHHMLAEQSQVSIDGELLRGERVLWRGRPNGSLLTPSDAVLIPFGLPWLGFALLWTRSAITHGGGPFALAGLPFIAAGLYMVAGRFWVKAKKRRETVYAVTNQRAIEKSGETLRSVSLANLPPLEVTSRGERGSIVFGPMGGQAAMYANTGMEWLARTQVGNLPVAFYDIPDVPHVARVIEDAAASLRSGETVAAPDPFAWR